LHIENKTQSDLPKRKSFVAVWVETFDEVVVTFFSGPIFPGVEMGVGQVVKFSVIVGRGWVIIAI